MDLSQAAFGLDMREASRIYFISPVLNPQVEAQAIGRVRRVSQQKPVSVETLALRGSIDEVILERKKHMSQEEHRKVKSILDVRPIYNWIKNARIIPMPDLEAELAPLHIPQQVFGRGFGKTANPDDGIVPIAETPSWDPSGHFITRVNGQGLKRAHEVGPGTKEASQTEETMELASHPPRRVRFASDGD
jgi:superfamily II DNA or RNA helicase